MQLLMQVVAVMSFATRVQGLQAVKLVCGCINQALGYLRGLFEEVWTLVNGSLFEQSSQYSYVLM